MTKLYLTACLSLILLYLPLYDCGYIVLAPEMFRRESMYKVHVGVETTLDPVAVAGTLRSTRPNSNTLLQSLVSVGSGSSAVLQFQIPLSADEGSYNLTVVGSGGLSFTNTTSVSLAMNDVLVLVQTDKAIYKPNQVVKMRVVGINDEYKVIKNRPLTVSIKDKDGNLLRSFKNQIHESGVIELEFPISDEPPLGDWKIEANMDGGSTIKEFKVDEYVLPKFEVTTEVNPGFVIYKQQNKVDVKVKAQYVYGENVDAKAVVTLKTDGQIRSTKTAILSKGEVSIPFVVEEMLGRDTVETFARNYYWFEKTVEISVNVTDQNTEFSITDEASVKFYTYPQKIHLEPFNDLKIFHQGAPVKFRVKVTDAVDKPLSEYGMTVKVTAGEVIKNVFVADAAGTIVSIDTDAKTDNMYIYATIGKENDNENKIAQQAYLNMNKYVATGPNLIQVTALDGSTIQTLDLDNNENQITLSVKSTGQAGFTLASYVVLSKGKIVADGFLDFSQTFTQNLNLAITSEMSPSATLLVYGVTNDGKSNELVVDVFELTINNGMKNKVTVKFSDSKLKASSPVSLTVTSDADAYCSVLAMDKSVMLLGGDNSITPDSVMEDFSMFTGDKKKNHNDLDPRIMFRRKRSISIPGYSEVNADALLTGSGLKFMTDIKYTSYSTLTRGPQPGVIDDGMPVLMQKPNLEFGMFKRATGVKYLTDLHVAKSNNNHIMFMQRANFGGAAPDFAFAAVPMAAENAKGPSPSAGQGAGGQLAEVTHVRKFFPETWLWLNGKTGANGQVVFSSTVPDTITTWHATAFSVSPVNGLGLTTTPAKLLAFQPFFISLNLPYSIRRGEIFELIVAVSNYLDVEVEVKITLEKSDDFAVSSINSIDNDFSHDDVERFTTIPSNKVTSEYFRVQAKKLGDILISVKAQTVGRSEADQLKKTVLVEPEGFKKLNSTVLSVDMENIDMYENTVDIWYPKTVVQGSKRAEVTVSGDVMGPTIKGLERLVRVPTGCGEQNMISFVPNIVVANYLTNVNKITPDIKKRSTDNMLTGYQRELKYNHPDGSYSAFTSDKSGSTWLSAFVLKSFSQANKFIGIDSAKQTKTFEWLTAQMSPDGDFNEPGRVIHTDMQGGAAKGNRALSAYVLSAMLESQDHIESGLFQTTTSKVLAYLEKAVDGNKVTEVYEKALIAYVFTQAKNPKANILLNELMSMENKPFDPNSQQATTESPSSKRKMGFTMPPKATSSDIETWSYVLLAHCANNDVASSRPIMKWLLSQQSSFGGYHSTQDTVVGISALAKYAELTNSAEKDLTIQIESGAQRHTFTVNKDNALLLQQFMLSPDSTSVKVTSTGRGMAIAKVNWRYYTTEDVKSLLPQNGPNKAPIFLTAATKRVTKTQSTVVTCVSCAKDIGMSLISIGMPSGNVPNNMDNIKKMELVRRAEVKDEALHLYMDKIPEAETCFNVELFQSQKVENLQDAPITAQAYYQTEIESSVMYNIDNNSKDFCDMCRGDGCDGCPKETNTANKWNKVTMTAVALICVLLSLICSV